MDHEKQGLYILAGSAVGIVAGFVAVLAFGASLPIALSIGYAFTGAGIAAAVEENS